jgi:SAM-dependent methyltransferase
MSDRWEGLPARLNYAEPYDELLAREYASVYTELIKRWVSHPGKKLILKTDLYDEALCRLRSFAANVSEGDDCMVGMDISMQIARAAMLAGNAVPSLQHYACCDVRFLPFAGNTFDLVISDSTLDHFELKDDIRRSLVELHRVLKPRGTMILSLDNSSNITEPLFRAWIALGLAPFYIGPTLSRDELLLVLKDIGFSVIDEAAIVHIPRFWGKKIVGLLRLLSKRKLDPVIAGWLRRLDLLEHTKIRYLTAQFIAVRAIKN